MNATLIVSLPAPENLQPEHANLFPTGQYEVQTAVPTRSLQNVFHSSTGICLQRGIPISETFYAGLHQRISLGVQTFRTYRAAVWKQRVPLRHLSAERHYLSLMHPWFNYYHFIFDWLPRLLSAPRDPVPAVLISEHLMEVEFVRSALACFPEFRLEVLPSGTHCLVPQLLVAPIRPDSRYYDPTILEVLAERLRRCSTVAATGPERIFISRQLADKRKISNFAEVSAVLRSNRFSIVDLETLSLAEQIRTLSNARIVVGVHGAGLSNVLFTRQPPTVLELVPAPSRNAYGGRVNELYRNLVAALNGSYFYQFGHLAGRQDAVLSANISIDPVLLEQNLVSALKYSESKYP